ncbi:hypothetical protein FBUS_01473 [Fasciolopsis buskii]|uniref:PLAC8 family protein n=1 Tax=Fasciolopsis buskii TaxID=27845 RepID=A0A8E0RU61_9TREM|nr:hypothetical protein FBUS_01473 [Fasciolopsis buski]
MSKSSQPVVVKGVILDQPGPTQITRSLPRIKLVPPPHRNWSVGICGCCSDSDWYYKKWISGMNKIIFPVQIAHCHIPPFLFLHRLLCCLLLLLRTKAVDDGSSGKRLSTLFTLVWLTCLADENAHDLRSSGQLLTFSVAESRSTWYESSEVSVIINPWQMFSSYCFFSPIQGTACKDCCQLCFCNGCLACQMHREAVELGLIERKGCADACCNCCVIYV